MIVKFGVHFAVNEFSFDVKYILRQDISYSSFKVGFTIYYYFIIKINNAYNNSMDFSDIHYLFSYITIYFKILIFIFFLTIINKF